MRRLWPWVLVVSAGTMGAACNAILGLSPPPSPDGGVATGGAGTTTTAGVCAALDAGAGATVEAGTYLPFSPVVSTDAGGTWDFFDMSGTPLSLGDPTCAGGTFDGRYVYIATRSKYVVQYDTQGGFAAPSSWLRFDATQVAPSQGGFSGVGYDGRFVYFVPDEFSGANVFQSTVVRYDTTGSGFKDPAAWSGFDLTTMTGPGADAGTGYAGAATDGHNLYLVPHNDGAPFGRVIRYAQPGNNAFPPLYVDGGADAGHGGDGGHADGGAEGGVDAGGGGGGEDAGAEDSAFTDAGAWSAFDLSTVNPQAIGFTGAVYDGNAVYFVPQANNAFNNTIRSGASSIVARLSVGSAFGTAFSTPSQWTVYDVSNINGMAFNFEGGAFDGRYVYFVPHTFGVVLRFDTRPSGIVNLDNPSLWSWYDVTRVVTVDGGAAQFTGAAFDGRFVYFLPSSNGFGQLLRYDTLSTFDADCAWSTTNLTTFPNATGGIGAYAGAVFDGQYVYLLPSGTNVIARFQARTPASMPALYSFPFHGSFY